MIHFQHDQEGATLRASEVKPKLDRFIIERTSTINIVRTEYPDWFVSKDHDALDYKLEIKMATSNYWNHFIEEPKKDINGEFKERIKDGKTITDTNSYPLFFGNMGSDYKKDDIKKFVFHSGEIKVKIKTFHPLLEIKIGQEIANFFCHYNFGTRQNKGFGSFFPEDATNFPFDEKQFDYKYSFIIDADNDPLKCNSFFREVFTKMNWFYCALRSGLNVKGFETDEAGERKIVDKQNVMKDEFYFKSLLFLYFSNLVTPVQWEKKTIKESFFANTKRNRNNELIFEGLDDQQFRRQKTNEFPLAYSSNNKLLVRDLLGLSSEEQWLSYKDKITKTEAKQDEQGNWKSKNQKDPSIIQRYASPIFFKPIITGNNCTVYIRLDNVALLGKTFMIENKTGDQFPLSTPDNFDLNHFFNFIMEHDNFNIETHVENINGFHNRREFIFLKSAFSSLTKIEK